MSVDLASAYVFRGATLNDGFVVQPGLEVSGLPIDLGVWANLDLEDYDGALAEGEFSEIDLYASYSLPIEALDVSIGYTEYTYPGAPAVTNGLANAIEADREVSLSVGLDVPLAPSVTVYYGLDGGIEESLYAEAVVGHSFQVCEDVALDLGAVLAYLDPDGGSSGFPFYSVSASTGYKFVSASVTYVGQIDDDVLSDDDYDVEVFGTLGVAFDF